MIFFLSTHFIHILGAGSPSADGYKACSETLIYLIGCNLLHVNEAAEGRGSVALGGGSNQTFCFCLACTAHCEDGAGFHLDNYAAATGTE